MMFVESAIHWKTSEFLKKQKRVKWKGLRWVSEDGALIYEWDSLHGEIEVYNRRGRIVAILHPDGHVSSKNIKAGRTIDV